MKTWTRIKTIIASISTIKSIYIFKKDRILVALLEREKTFYLIPISYFCHVHLFGRAYDGQRIFFRRHV